MTPRTILKINGQLLFICLCSLIASAIADTLAPEHVNGAETIDTATAKSLFDRGYPFIDVRNLDNFNAGHIPGAHHLSVKNDFSEQSLHAIATRNDPVVIYCNGIHCMGSSVAAQKAVDWGWINVFYYRAGMPDWKLNGHPIQTVLP